MFEWKKIPATSMYWDSEIDGKDNLESEINNRINKTTKYRALYNTSCLGFICVGVTLNKKNLVY